MTEVIVDIDSAYLELPSSSSNSVPISASSDPISTSTSMIPTTPSTAIPAGFEPILAEHGQALQERLRQDKACVNIIPQGKGLKPTSVSNLDSILYQLDDSTMNHKTLLPTIRFRRKVNYTLDIKRRTKAPLSNGEFRTFIEPTTLILLTSGFLAELIKTDRLLIELQKIRDATDIHHQIFLVVQGLNNDWKKQELRKQRDYTERIRRALDDPNRQVNVNGIAVGNGENMTSNQHSNSAGTGIGFGTASGLLSKEKVESALMRLRIAMRAFVVNVNTREDVADWVHNIACDIATRTDK